MPYTMPSAKTHAGIQEPCYWIYILQLENGYLYTGYTEDLVQRYRKHIKGRAAKCTRSFKPVKIAQCWRLYDTRSAAMKVEALIKHIKRKDKKILVENPKELKNLILDKLDLDLKIRAFNPHFIEKKS